MNRLVTAVAALAVLLAAGSTASALDEKLGFVNLDRVFNEYYKTKLADAQLKEQAAEFNEERRKLTEEFEKLQQEFNTAREEAQNMALSEEVRNTKRSEAEEKLIVLRDKEASIRRFDETRRKQLEDQGRRMRKRLVDEIGEAVKTFAKNQDFVAVIDYSGLSLNSVPLILYTDAKHDITQSLIEVLNKGQ